MSAILLMTAMIITTGCKTSSLFSKKHAYVDLGLPSGTLWATCNVGASAPEEYGDYFAWGETCPKKIYNWSTYKYYNAESKRITKYCTKSDYGNQGFTDDLTVLQHEDDAATVNWGSDWRTPTDAEWKELYNSCTSMWTTQNGVKGILFTGPSGKRIFLPAAGGFWDDEFDRIDLGDYWSSSLIITGPDIAYRFFFDDREKFNGVMGSYRFCGQPVRPVRSRY